MLLVNENFEINNKLSSFLGSQFPCTFLHFFPTQKFIFVNFPRDFLFLNYFDGFTGKAFEVSNWNYKIIALCFVIVEYWT